jgi:hypothetical protein
MLRMRCAMLLLSVAFFLWTQGVEGGDIQSFQVEPNEIHAAQPVTVRLSIKKAASKTVRIATPYCHAESETLSGFQYDSKEHKSYRTGPSASDSPTVELKTDRWPPGAHHFQLQLLDASGKVCDYRDFVVKVPGPNDHLKVTVVDSWLFGPDAKFSNLLRLRNGTILCQGKHSDDGGRIWQGDSTGFGAGGVELRDGRVLGLEYKCLPLEGEEGWYANKAFVSTDSGRNFLPRDAKYYVPQAKPARGHAMHRGPLYMRSIVERTDGSLVALMAGWFKEDKTECPFGHGRPYSRSYVCESSDGGLTWRYLSTICCEHIGSEGCNEGSMRRLPSGDFLAVLRTGNETDSNHYDNPILWSTSGDEGRSWSKPQRTGVDGAYPNLAVLSDGVVAMCYGRPGTMLVFSADGGRTWTDPTCVEATVLNGYANVVELSPGTLLVGMDLRKYLDPVVRLRQNQFRLALVRYEKK